MSFDESTGSQAPVEIMSGYRPGAIGRVTEMHAIFYTREWGLGPFFESRVARDMAEFATRLSSPANGLWLAIQRDRIVGSIAIDGEDLGPSVAHLRWFILDDGCRGGGVGRRLLSEAVAFSDARGHAAIELSTFQGLDAARRLYESFGFALVDERPGEQWGKRVVEQKFIRARK